MAAMTHYPAPEDGLVGEAELAYVARRSSGPGVVFTACVATSPDGKAYGGEPGPEAAQAAARDHAEQSFAVGYRFTPEEALEPGLSMDDALAFVEALIERGCDFIGVLVNGFRSSTRGGAMAKGRSRLAYIAQAVGGRTSVLADGAIFTEKDGRSALATGADFATFEHALIIEPQWVQKNAARSGSSIRTMLKAHDREALTMPQPFWTTIWTAPGWFPGVVAGAER